ncbi:MAG: cobalt-precorrin-5B (C(1))-methyltransferase [Methanosarcinales archaeon]|jgi:cobalt-precorrin-5B (C1)-methyltransferase|nr:cobalt-precorrin-5B (C(1))-methyltransferase [Methanosarcinales archaeon]
MKDPVNDFEIPEEWTRKSPLPRAEVEDLVSRGLIVVLSDGSFLKRGFTTGTTAAAAAKAAVLSIGKALGIGTVVSIPTPIGLRAEIEIEFAKDGEAGVRKVYNDHESDITRDVLFCAKVKMASLDDPEFSTENAVDNILITGGIGVGIIQRAGFETPIGAYAINPKPLSQIRESVKEGLREIGLFDEVCVKKESALIVSIYVPDGIELSKKTLNERIGIIGGISILGTTGFVEPWNDHLGEMKDVLIQDAKKLVLTTGRQGMATSSMLFPGYEIVMVGSRITEGIEAAVSAEEIVVCGLPGLVLKWGNPDMLKDSGFATVVEVLEKDPKNALLKQAFEMCIKKGKGARIVVIDREGLVLMDSKGEFDYLMKS